MNSPPRIGIHVLKTLPVTGIWTLPFTAYLVYLSNRIVYYRLKEDKYIGDHLDEPPPENSYDRLQIASRAHANFTENVPFAFLLTAIAELNGANRKVLNYSMVTLFVLRILHVEFGLRREDALGNGRPLGYYGTQGFLAGMAGYCAWLSKDYWGY